MAFSPVGLGLVPPFLRPVLDKPAGGVDNGQEARSALDPQDTFAPAEQPAVASERQVRDAGTGADSRKSIDGMLAHDTKNKPATPEQVNDLRASLGKVDPAVLSYAQSRGLKVSVVHAGDDLRDVNVLRQKSPADIDRDMPKMAAFANNLNADMAKYDKPIAQGEAERAALLKKKGAGDNPLYGMGIMGQAPDKDLLAIDTRIGKLRIERNKAMGAALDKTDLPVNTFHMPQAPGGGGMFGATAAMMNNMPVSTDAMAEVQGFRTKEEKAQFNKWMGQLNGDRLTTARQESLKNLTDMLAKQPNNPELKAMMAEAKAHPEQIPVDHVRHNILVPDLQAWRPSQPQADPFAPPPPPKGAPTYLDEHDAQTMRNWTANEGGRVAKPYDSKSGKGTPLLGQYFAKEGVNRMIVGDNALKDGTPEHELGHAIDFLVEKEDPAFHKPWMARLEKAYDAAGKGDPRHQISEYSRTNPREYLAEGFRNYYDDPKLLKSKDPVLYGLVAELTRHAAELQNGKK